MQTRHEIFRIKALNYLFLPQDIITEANIDPELIAKVIWACTNGLVTKNIWTRQAYPFTKRIPATRWIYKSISIMAERVLSFCSWTDDTPGSSYFSHCWRFRIQKELTRQEYLNAFFVLWVQDIFSYRCKPNGAASHISGLVVLKKNQWLKKYLKKDLQ